MSKLIYTFRDINYEIEHKPRNKNVYYVISDGKLTLRLNLNRHKNDIDDLLEKKYDWIKSKLNKIPKRNFSLAQNADIYFLGDKYQLNIIDSTDFRVITTDGKFNLYTPTTNETSYRYLINLHFQQTLYDIIDKQLEKWTAEMNLFPRKISYRSNKSIWGSCSYKNNISFNTRLAQLPIHIIEYIVVHELSHIKHKNHSADFWQFVSHFLPNYKIDINTLREYERLITL